MEKEVLGIDIGGSGVKGALVNCKKGKLITKRIRYKTPAEPTPANIVKTILKLVSGFNWKGSIGVGFPGVIQKGVVKTAANLHPDWIETNIEHLLSEQTGCRVFVTNDADAAALAEYKFGRGKKNKDVVFFLTIGTGIGTVIFTKGKLLPNCELGHLTFHDMPAEHYASDAVRENEKLSWEEWGYRLNEYLLEIERLFWPDFFILGGGASKHFKKYVHCFTIKARIKPAKLLNEAGMIGAALWARENYKEFYKKLKKL